MALAQGGGPRADSAGLPDEGSLRLRGELEQSLRRADRALCRLEGAAAALPASAAFWRMQLRCEAVDSCLLDGTRVSLPGLLAVEAGLAPPEVSQASEAASWCVQAMERLLVSPDRDALAPDTLQEAIGLLHAPAASEPARRFLGDVAAALGDRSKLPPLVRIGFVLARTELSGPFDSAAGRIGRLLAGAALARRTGIPMGLSGRLRRHARDYRSGLESVSDTGAWDGWIAFFLRVAEESAGECADTAARFAALREGVRGEMADQLGYALPKGLAVLERLLLQPLASVSDVQGITRTSYVAANGLVSRLAELGVLEEITGHRRNRVFWFGRYAKVFEGSDSGSSVLPPVATRDTAADSMHSAAPETPQDPVAREQPPKPPSKRRGQLSDHLL